MSDMLHFTVEGAGEFQRQLSTRALALVAAPFGKARRYHRGARTLAARMVPVILPAAPCPGGVAQDARLGAAAGGYGARRPAAGEWACLSGAGLRLASCIGLADRQLSHCKGPLQKQRGVKNILRTGQIVAANVRAGVVAPSAVQANGVGSLKSYVASDPPCQGCHSPHVAICHPRIAHMR